MLYTDNVHTFHWQGLNGGGLNEFIGFGLLPASPLDPGYVTSRLCDPFNAPIWFLTFTLTPSVTGSTATTQLGLRA